MTEQTPGQIPAQAPAPTPARTPARSAAQPAHGDGPPRLTRLAFHGPLSDERAARMVARLARTGPRSVLDAGCGWGELMLRLLAAVPDASGTGLDVRAEDLDRGRRNAAARGLADRVAFVEESALGTARGPADVVLCLGASHALSEAPPPRHTPQALAELRRLVAPGGRVLFGEGYWQRPPQPAELARMWPGASADDHVDLGTLVGLAVDADFRPEWTETANADEWDDFESGYQADVEEWIAAHCAHPLADETRRRVDDHRAAYTAYRGVLGIAYLTLVPVAG